MSSSPKPPGSTVDNGVLVDASLHTSDPAIYAVGDIANQEHPVAGRPGPGRALGQRSQPAGRGRCRDRRQPAPYDELPYFYTDQYDLGMEYVGHAPPGSLRRRS